MESKYIEKCTQLSDINEHLPTLYEYAKNCESVFETGVRGCVSSYAFALGLLHNGSTKKRFLMNDIVECDISELLPLCSDIDVNSIWKNNLELEFKETFDLTFIDTWHVYGQLKRELHKFKEVTNKYIIMHDTTVDAIDGESIRMGSNIEHESEVSGIPVEEITRGLWPAIEEFLESNPEWVIQERFTNNNGLTVLKKIK